MSAQNLKQKLSSHLYTIEGMYGTKFDVAVSFDELSLKLQNELRKIPGRLFPDDATMRARLAGEIGKALSDTGAVVVEKKFLECFD